MAVTNILFLVGIGATTEIYQPLLQQLHQHFPQAKIEILNWWQQADFGMQAIHDALHGEQTLLVGHSAGGIEVRCLPMNHFDLVNAGRAREISKIIAD